MKRQFASLFAVILCLFVCRGLFAQADAGNDANVRENAKKMAVLRGQADEALRGGKYRDAYNLYLELLKSPENPPEDAANDFGKAARCLRMLGNGDGMDKERAEQERKELAMAADTSTRNFQRRFLSLMKTHPVDYLNGIRLRHAAEKLSSSDMHVIDIAHFCGFNDLGYFGRKFHAAYGTSPLKYRRLHQNARLDMRPAPSEPLLP